ncbi:MAG: YchF family ATPase [Anaerohalosphaeraceae bacterium]|nr:YchF family ATPase [Anaerohalosphaeraceae bacterium]
MKVAVMGLMQSGKSTLISAISSKALPQAGSVQIEEAMATVPDERIDWLTDFYKPKKTVHATIDCLDLPGMSFADDHTRAAARRLLGQIRTAELLVLVIRAFDLDGSPATPSKDLVDLRTEILLADYELVETRIERLEKQVNKPSKEQAKQKAELAIQLKLREAIESEKPLSSAIVSDDEMAMVKSLGFLTLQPMVVVLNTPEDEPNKQIDLAGAVDDDTPIVSLSAKLECELSQLDAESRAEFMSDLGIAVPAVNKFVQGCNSALGLICFLTVGPDEVRAWPITAGTTAVDAAGKIHSDIKRGFIRAETMSYDDLKQLGDEKAVKAAGKVRLEGKSYVVADGDIINFRFNV